MSLVKKMISCGLALSLALGGIAGVSRVSAENGSLTTGQKIVGGVSAVGGIGLLAGIGIGAWHHCHNLPVLIIGGDSVARNNLIVNLKYGDHQKISSLYPCLINVGSAIEHRITTSHTNVDGVEKGRAKFKNWKISECGVDDPNAAKLMEDARLVIAILTDEQSTVKLDNLIARHKLSDCFVVSFVDMGYNVKGGHVFGGQRIGSVRDLMVQACATYSDSISYTSNAGNLLKKYISVPDSLSHMGFCWNRDDDTFIYLTYST